MEHEQQTMEETLAMSKRKFLERCEAWLEEFNDGKSIHVDNFKHCPYAAYIILNDQKCSRQMVPTTAICPICNLPMCPDCGNHNVEIISRVTGYLSTVSGWNSAKKQEFEDRQRYESEDQNR